MRRSRQCWGNLVFLSLTYAMLVHRSSAWIHLGWSTAHTSGMHRALTGRFSDGLAWLALPASQAAMLAHELTRGHKQAVLARIAAEDMPVSLWYFEPASPGSLWASTYCPSPKAHRPAGQMWPTAPAARPLATFSQPVTRTRQPIASSTAPAHLLPSTTSCRRQGGNGWSSGLWKRQRAGFSVKG